MCNNISGKTPNKKTDIHYESADEQHRGAVEENCSDKNAEYTYKNATPPNWVEKGGLFVLGLTLAVACYAGYEGTRLADLTDQSVQETQETIIEANRAWIAFSYPDFGGQLKVGDPIPAYISYWNPGRSPALKEGSQMISRGIPSNTEPSQQDLLGVCDKISHPGVGIVFPNSGEKHDVLYMPTRKLVTEDVIKGDMIVYWTGCFKYQTFGETRYTRFCFRLDEIGDPQRWQWDSCGHDAD